VQIVDLSMAISTTAPVHPSQPLVSMAVWSDHASPVTWGATTHSARSLQLSFGDHTGTHVDAPSHFDPQPDAATIDQLSLEQFYAPGLCVDLSHAPLRHAVTVDELQQALAIGSQRIKPGDVVLIYLATHTRLRGTDRHVHDFAGLSPDTIHWLADEGVSVFGVEAVSPAPEGEPNLRAHQVCAERGITHIECLENLDLLLGRGPFRFVGLPLKLSGGTAGPMRAVAVFE
jgi:kynurenine formamidase